MFATLRAVPSVEQIIPMVVNPALHQTPLPSGQFADNVARVADGNLHPDSTVPDVDMRNSVFIAIDVEPQAATVDPAYFGHFQPASRLTGLASQCQVQRIAAHGNFLAVTPINHTVRPQIH